MWIKKIIKKILSWFKRKPKPTKKEVRSASPEPLNPPNRRTRSATQHIPTVMTATEGYVYARKTDHYQYGKVIHIGVNDKEENWELILEEDIPEIIEEEPLNEEYYD